MKRNTKPWDCAIPEATLALVKDRRLAPDGNEWQVGTVLRDGVEVLSYPWKDMKVGDYFIAPIRGSKGAMLTTFRQTAARYNWEISISNWEVDGHPYLRVTKVLEGIAGIKKMARERGAHAPMADVKARAEYHKRRRRGETTTDGLSKAALAIAPVSILPSDPTAPVVHRAPAAELDYDRAAKMAEIRRLAALEKAGLDEDDEDFMGVHKDG